MSSFCPARGINAAGGNMREGHGQIARGPSGRVRRWFGSERGHFAVDAGVAVFLIAIILGQSWVRQGSLAGWRVYSAAHRLERDLGLARQAANAAGSGAQAEVCLRSDGYDIYMISRQARAGLPTQAAGTKIKSATAGRDYAREVAIIADPIATYRCTADISRRALVYLGSGAPKFPDAEAHRVVVTLHGHALHVTIQPGTGTTHVGR